VNSAISGATRHFAYQVGLNLTDLGFGMLGAFMVIVAGAAWRRAQPAAPDRSSRAADKQPRAGT
jgi:hypothetical protein